MTFSTNAYADITFLGDVDLAMLKMMGHGATVPGAVVAEDVPAAQRRLTAAIEKGKAASPAEDRHAEEPAVSLSRRALPLIELLTAVAKAKTYVMWK